MERAALAGPRRCVSPAAKDLALAPLPLSDTIQARFEHQAALRPTAIAASCDDQQLTYAQLNAKANQPRALPARSTV